MDEYRSKSYGDGRMELDNYYGPTNNNNNNNNNHNGVGFQDLRCYSASYATSARTSGFDPDPKELRKTKTGKAAATSTAWCFSDPELQRKKRVASYKSYSVEAKLKRSFSKSFRWIKHRYTNIVNGS
ncbi:uncharacterized protein LOC141607910 [Silene latifolia]|uniref:uncharacterized protein LOC141607910 n=1 Tax=Silene latifolia TaxID=37657 RepID=UPI003D76BD9D